MGSRRVIYFPTVFVGLNVSHTPGFQTTGGSVYIFTPLTLLSPALRHITFFLLLNKINFS